jgi:hypothetical protein
MKPSTGGGPAEGFVWDIRLIGEIKAGKDIPRNVFPIIKAADF